MKSPMRSLRFLTIAAIAVGLVASSSFGQGLGNNGPANRPQDPPPRVDPDRGPEIHLTGTFELRDGQSVDLEDGDVRPASGHIRYAAPAGGEALLMPVNGTIWSYQGRTQPGYQACAEISALGEAQSAYAVSSLGEGDFFCARTAGGLTVELRIDRIQPLLRRLSGSFTTWEWRPVPISN